MISVLALQTDDFLRQMALKSSWRTGKGPSCNGCIIERYAKTIWPGPNFREPENKLETLPSNMCNHEKLSKKELGW